ncbi:nucleomorphin-like [Phalaenopsis equestris]|uniref:nucleomorphin-like n=1 Tax=Phalaenopsis equestris TaxID=78828 RepID=UPI0009E4D473|nr:nucleomorphin-like [Phalaenopsis equestris]XP_020596444.1 nucleomorphin-like [Phalaenopsis equestris]
MMRLSASRNQRSKGGFRVKLVLQICLLLAICTWLLYQVKHSHDKKKAFEDKISQIASMEVSKQPHLFDLGRKSLPLLKEKDLTSDNHVKEDGNEEDEGGEQEQDQDQDQDMKQEDTKDEDEFFSEEEKDGQVDEDDFDLQEEEGSAQEAREENYKRDDASSAVAHDSSMEIEDSKGNDLESSANGTVDVGMNNNNETLVYVAPPISTISNVSNASFGENITLINSDLSINGSHSTEVLQQNEQKLANTTTPTTTTTTTTNLPVDNAFDNSSVAIQNGSKFYNSVSTREVSQLAKSGLIPVQDQNYKSDDHPLSSDLLTNGVKDSDDKAAE